jgi:hypothetical protein
MASLVAAIVTVANVDGSTALGARDEVVGSGEIVNVANDVVGTAMEGVSEEVVSGGATTAVVVVDGEDAEVEMAADVAVAVAWPGGTAVVLPVDEASGAAAPLWYTFKELIVQ